MIASGVVFQYTFDNNSFLIDLSVKVKNSSNNLLQGVPQLGLVNTRFDGVASPANRFLFGGPVAAGDLIVRPIKEGLAKSVLPIFNKRDIPILVSELDLGHAAILGASALVWN